MSFPSLAVAPSRWPPFRSFFPVCFSGNAAYEPDMLLVASQNREATDEKGRYDIGVGYMWCCRWRRLDLDALFFFLTMASSLTRFLGKVTFAVDNFVRRGSWMSRVCGKNTFGLRVCCCSMSFSAAPSCYTGIVRDAWYPPADRFLLAHMRNWHCVLKCFGNDDGDLSPRCCK